jgi:putative membrane protein
MPFTDYVTLMLINMAGAYAIIGTFVGWGITSEQKKHWASAFAVPGLVALVTGFMMTFTAPLPKPYNTPFGEMTVLLGVLMLGAALSLAAGWRLMPLTIYAFFAGLAAVIIGLRIINAGLTQNPTLSGVGFILSGLAGILSPVFLRMSASIAARFFAVVICYAVVAIWAFTGYMAYWIHLLPPAK